MRHPTRMTTGRIVARDRLLAGTGLYQSKMLLQPVSKKLFAKHIRQTAKKIIHAFLCNLLLKSIHDKPTKNAIICGQSFACKRNVFEQRTRQTKKTKTKCKIAISCCHVLCKWKARKGGTGQLINARSSGRNYRIWEGFGFDSCCAYWLPGFQRPALPALGWWRTALRRCWSKRKRCPVLEQSGGGDSSNTGLMSVADMGFSSK